MLLKVCQFSLDCPACTVGADASWGHAPSRSFSGTLNNPSPSILALCEALCCLHCPHGLACEPSFHQPRSSLSKFSNPQSFCPNRRFSNLSSHTPLLITLQFQHTPFNVPLSNLAQHTMVINTHKNTKKVQCSFKNVCKIIFEGCIISQDLVAVTTVFTLQVL